MRSYCLHCNPIRIRTNKQTNKQTHTHTHTHTQQSRFNYIDICVCVFLKMVPNPIFRGLPHRLNIGE